MAESIAAACLAVLLTPEPKAKIKAARRAAREWRLGRLGHRFDIDMPDRPARPDAPILLAPRDMPKRGSAGSDRSRIALVHSLAHIEFSAIDLAVDLVGRFGGLFPPAFVDDWMRIAAEEAMHFALLDRRLRALGSHYGALPAHEGLWDAAFETRHDAAARLAIVPLVLEARGLDVTPQTMERLLRAGDAVTARILRRILDDEIRHVAAGRRWFGELIDPSGEPLVDAFKRLVNSHFRGRLKPPFNDSARDKAGLTRDFYTPLAD